MTTSNTINKNNTINKTFKLGNNSFIFKVITPSHKMYLVSYGNNLNDYLPNTLSIIPFNQDNFPEQEIIMDFSKFSSNDPFSHLDSHIEQLRFKEYQKEIDYYDARFFDCHSIYNIADHISDALAIGEKVTVNVISNFSSGSRDLQAESMYNILKMNKKYKEFNPGDNDLKSSIKELKKYTDNMFSS